MKKPKLFTFIALLLCFSLLLPVFSGAAVAGGNKASIVLNESFDNFTSQNPAGFVIYNKNGGEITGEQITDAYKCSLKYSISNKNKVDVSLQYNFQSPLSGQLILETKVRAEQDNLFFPLFQLRDGSKNNVLAQLSSGKILVGDAKEKLVSYVVGKWYHLCFAIDLDTGKMDVYLDKEKKLENISFWTKNKSNQPVEVKNITSFKNYLKGQAGKTLTVYQDDIRIYTGKEPIFNEDFFKEQTADPGSNDSGLPLEPLPDYYENPSADRIISDLKVYNPGQEHPRLFLRRTDIEQLKERIQRDALMHSWYENLKKQGNKIIKEPVGTPVLKDGRRMQAAKDARPRIETTALLYLLSGEEKYRERAINEIKAVIQFPDWNHSNEFLNTAEMAAGVAIGYDWLYDELSEDLRREIRTALEEKALKKAKQAYDANVWWYQKRELINNWNAVCNGGIGMAALAIGDESPEITGYILAKAIPSLERAILMEFVPDGGWAEGPGYWRYTIEYVVSFLASLESAVGTMYGMEKTPGLKETAYFPIYLTGPNGSFNYADASSNKMKMPELFWLAQKVNDLDIAQARLNLMKEAGQTGGVYDLLWYRPKEETVLDLGLDKYFGKTEVFTMRSRWNDPYACFVGLKGGKAYNSHAHMDIGNFVFQASGETWVEDIGSDNYTGRYFDYDNYRFYYYRAKAEGHNTIVINPDGTYQQNHRSENPVEKMESKPQGAFAIINMTGAYEKNAVSAKRGVMLAHNREILIVQDQVQLKQPSQLYWFIHSTADISIQPDGKSVILEKNGKKVWLEMISPEKQDLRFQVGPAVSLPGEPLMADQADNSKYRRVFVAGEAQSDFELAVAFIPLKYGEDKPDILPTYSPLEEWAIPDGEITKPALSSIALDGMKLRDFSSGQYYYDIALPFGTKALPVITAESDFSVEIEAPKNFLEPAVITVRDLQNPKSYSRYVLRFHILPGHSQPSNSQRLTVRQATASTYQNQPEKSQVNPPEHAIDGNALTRWAAEGNQWICLELDKVEIVESAAIAFARGNNRIFQFEIETSTDGSNWQTLYKGSNSGLSTELEYFSLQPLPAKYVRIQGKGNSQNQWNTYSEVEIWGKEFHAPSSASKAALEVFVASSAAIRLQPEYIQNTKEKKAALDRALAEAEKGLQNPVLSEEEWQILYSNLERAFQQIKVAVLPQPEKPASETEPLTAYQSDEGSFPIIPKKPKIITGTLGQPKSAEEQTVLLEWARKKLTGEERKLLTTALSARTLVERKAAASRLDTGVLKTLAPRVLAPYGPIPDNAWYRSELTVLEVLNFCEDSFRQSFGSGRPLTVQELRALFARLAGETVDTAEKTVFLKQMNRIGSEVLTREELAYFITEFAQSKNIKMPEAEIKEFSDVETIHSDYQAAVHRLCGAGIMRGYPDGSFRPETAVSRQEIAVILYRLLKIGER